MLIVFAGRPGTGKTTISQVVASRLQAALLRIDAIELAVVRAGLANPPVGPVGYLVAHEVASSCLAVGTPVVADAVNAVAEARQGWREVATRVDIPLRFVEVELRDPAEHRRRVEQRRPDMDGQVVPTWEQVLTLQYEVWDEHRDGPRLLVDGADPHTAAERILDGLRLLR